MPTEHRARKRFGQNFLRSEAVIQAIVRAVAPQPDDTVIEIGPGLGALTAPLSGCLNTLHVIEIDRDIVQYLQKQPFAEKLIIHQGDVLQFDFHSIGGRKKIVGNLPYNISTPLLLRLSGLGAQAADMHFMLQKEVVDRMCAAPGSKDYGRLGIVLQYFFDMEKLLDVPPEAFDPAPQVDSAVVRMIPDAGRIGLAEDFPAFSRLVAQAFSMRRKTLRNNLKNTADDADLLALGIDPALRPENIPPEAYVQLSNRLARKKR